MWILFTSLLMTDHNVQFSEDQGKDDTAKGQDTEVKVGQECRQMERTGLKERPSVIPHAAL